MGKQFEEITPELRGFIERQHLFFVASAPLSGHGSVNASPKGAAGDTFRIVDERSVFYVDLTGSGTETAAHLRVACYEPGNGRLTIMFVQLEEGPPNIVRLFGKGRVFERGTAEYEKRTEGLDLHPGTRAIVWMDIDAVTTACGFSVPIYEHLRPRPTLDQFMQKLEDADADDRPSDGMHMYWDKKNAVSIDGMDGIGTRIGQQFPGVERVEKVLRHHTRNGTSLANGKRQPPAPPPAWVAGVPVGILLTLLALRISAWLK